jgi:DNA-binding GntR family transcriptional regulator
MAEIEGGTYKVGDLMPTEFELCEQFGASRFTVREAIKRLVQGGMVSRQAGVGTRVLGYKKAVTFASTLEKLSDLDQYAGKYTLRVTSSEPVKISGDLSKQLEGLDGQVWLWLKGVREGSDKGIVALSDVYIHPAFRSISGLSGRLTKTIYSRIEQQFGERIAEVSQKLVGAVIDEAGAKLLGVKKNSAGIRAIRHYRNQRQEVVMMSLTTYPADRFSYHQTFYRDNRGSV